MDDYEKRIREKVFNAGILSNGEWVYLVGAFGALDELDEMSRDATDKASAWDKLAEKNVKISGLQAKLDQIAAVCRDNAAPSCDKGMALDFVRQVAESAQSANNET